MNRREFIALIGGVATWSFAARARKPRVGYVWTGVRGTDVSNAGLRQGLTDVGYVVGRNLILEETVRQWKPRARACAHRRTSRPQRRCSADARHTHHAVRTNPNPHVMSAFGGQAGTSAGGPSARWYQLSLGSLRGT